MILPFTTHQGPNGRRFTPTEPCDACCDGASTEFANVRRGADSDRVPPNNTGVEEAEVRRKTGKGEVLRNG